MVESNPERVSFWDSGSTLFNDAQDLYVGFFDAAGNNIRTTYLGGDYAQRIITHCQLLQNQAKSQNKKMIITFGAYDTDDWCSISGNDRTN
jgi:hypothetical protein